MLKSKGQPVLLGLVISRPFHWRHTGRWFAVENQFSLFGPMTAMFAYIYTLAIERAGFKSVGRPTRQRIPFTGCNSATTRSATLPSVSLFMTRPKSPRCWKTAHCSKAGVIIISFRLWLNKFNFNLIRLTRIPKNPPISFKKLDCVNAFLLFKHSLSVRDKTRSSSADEIANVNYLPCPQQRLCVGTQVYQIQWNNAM